MDETLEQEKSEKVRSILTGYRDFLRSSEYSNATIKNYLSDLRHLIDWIDQRYQKFSFVHLDISSLRAYRSFVKEKFRAKPSIAARRLSSLRKFLGWAGGQKYVPEYLVRASEEILLESPTAKPASPAPLGVQILTSGVSTLEKASNNFGPQNKSRPPMPDHRIKKLIYHIKYLRPAWYERYHESTVHRPLHFAMLGIFILLIANMMFGNFIEGFLKGRIEGGQQLAATAPPSILSFQGRLTDSNGVPITSSSTFIFKIWDARSAGSALWTSKTWTVTPDSNGIFSVCLGNQTTTDDCIAGKVSGDQDNAFGSTLFSDNSALYLGITVGADSEMTPRQRISSVSFAMNSDTLDGVDSGSLLRSDTSDSFTSGTLTIGPGALAVTGTDDSDDDCIYFDTGTSESLCWDNSVPEFEFSSSLTVKKSAIIGNVNTDAIDGIVSLVSSYNFSGSDCDQGFFAAQCSAQWNVVKVSDTQNEAGDDASALILSTIVDDATAGAITLTTSKALYVTGVIMGTNDVLTNNYGIYIEDQTAGSTLNYGLYIAGGNTAALYTASDPVTFVFGAADKLTLDGGATDRTADLVSIDFDVNSSNAASIFVDLDVGTALSSGEIADGLKIDVAGNASDNAAAAVNGLRLIGATASGAPVTAIDIETTFDTDINLQNDETIDNAVNGVISFGGSLQGDTKTSDLTNTSGTTTLTDSVLAFYLSSTDTTGGCDDATFDLTGITSAEGSFVFIVSKANDNGCSGTTQVTTVSINSSTVSSVASAGGVVIENYLAVYVNAGWRVIGTPSTADTFDLAEWIPYTGAEPQPGELVTVSTSQSETVEKSTQPYDRKLLGIVSTDPHTTMGTPTDQSVRLALSGRVPTKVSTENGPIAIGDPLTSSSIPGVAMKANRSGPIVGKALSSYNDPDPSAVGSVIVFVDTSWYFSEENTVVNQLKVGLTAASVFEWTDSFGGTVAWVNDLGEAVFTKVTALFGDFQKLVFGELVAKRDSGTAGEASFESGQTEVVIETGKIKDDSLISITPTTKTNGVSIYIKEKHAGVGFTVALERNRGDLPGEASASARQAIKFNWLIVNQE